MRLGPQANASDSCRINRKTVTKQHIFFVLFIMTLFCFLYRLFFFISVLPLDKLNHAGCSVLTVISRMATGRLFGIHFFPVFCTCKFHDFAPQLDCPDIFRKTRHEKQYIYAAGPPLSRFFRFPAVTRLFCGLVKSA
jgi:hypothetical protein